MKACAQRTFGTQINAIQNPKGNAGILKSQESQHRMAQEMCHRAEQISNLFLPATKSLLAVRLHKEKGALKRRKTTNHGLPFSKERYNLVVA